jgi:hypothetical protein
MLGCHPMQKLTIIIGQELKEVDSTLSGTEPDQVIHGQLYEYPKMALVTLLGHVSDGRVFTSVNGKRYKMTALESDGKFTLKADF